MKKYFALVTNSGELRLRYIGEFEYIGDAIEEGDKQFKFVIWTLAEEDVKLIVSDFGKDNYGI